MSSTFNPVNIGVVGMGGYGIAVIQSLEQDMALTSPHARLTAVCSNDFDKHPHRCAELKARGIKLIENIDEFFAEPTEAVWLPLPIHLHRPMTEKALAAGKVVMCEKPAAGCIDDVDAMIAARDKARKPVIIGFGDIYDPTTLPLKRELLSGRIGKIQTLSMFGCWPRGKEYYTRSDWAGAFKRSGAWVIDSPVQNAMSHYLNLALYLLGPTEETSAQPVEVEAELYRVNPIENYDTVSMRLTLDNGVKLLLMMTHACREQLGPDLVIQGKDGRVVRTLHSIDVDDNHGGHTQTPRHADVRLMMIRRIAKLVRGIPDPDIGVATLEVARAQVLAANGASEAASIKTLDESLYEIVERPRGPLRVVHGIEQAFEKACKEQKMLHEAGVVKWSVPAGRKDLRGYRSFAGPKDMHPR